ncbi:Shwachman-Bodian-Diamond_syndrome protein-like protein [Hexamita inflata]|uniref:Shwachman-Bodian-Diamond syndrome protein-like protein n=1 Tax=Hexamita inflata TaxID=28002 RepID=A0AA86TZP3_9EUKA|nr:Shwachman-Bodian-Diamond syndrome protein-like protein [Hexamita inflata]
MKICLPETQKWLTNVISVSLQKNGYVFEIACYMNKVRAFRSGVEKDISQVLQTDTIFLDMVLGKVHNTATLLETFQTSDKATISEYILKNGRVQITEQERQTEQSRLMKEIVSIVHQRTFCEKTGLPFPAQLIEEAAQQQLHFQPNAFPVSEQAASLIKQLQGIVDIQMRPIQLQIELANEYIDALINKIGKEMLTYAKEDGAIYCTAYSDSVGQIKEELKLLGCKFDLQVQKTFKIK